ncbi:hypothetical protein SAY86_006195 [Trapa natans]|uniref:Uncharacterized protein n=1 Tax=Trapa natans TaxID=22666 RepID=A0AAN7QU29_TRANT|nr:hypothetical protein SAY86_006195 [Trapa natans]
MLCLWESTYAVDKNDRNRSSPSSLAPPRLPFRPPSLTPPTSPSALHIHSPFLDDPFRLRFEKLRFLEGYFYSEELKLGWLTVRVMRAEEMDETVGLLAEFLDSMLLRVTYLAVQQYLVKQYLIERRRTMPHKLPRVLQRKNKG